MRCYSATAHHSTLRSANADCIRLGLGIVRGLNAVHGRQIVAARSARAFESLQDFRFRTGLGAEELRALAKIGALNGLSEHRRAALWQVEENVDPGDLFSWTKSHASNQR